MKGGDNGKGEGEGTEGVGRNGEGVNEEKGGKGRRKGSIGAGAIELAGARAPKFLTAGARGAQQNL